MAAETGADAGQGFPTAVRADRPRSTSDEAVDDIAWSDGDVLVGGSSSLEPVAGVPRLARDQDPGLSPVPVIVPRGAVEDPTAS